MITQGFCEDILARHDFDVTEVKLLAKAWIEHEQELAALRDRLEVLTEPGTPIAIVNAMFDYAIAECGHQRHGFRHAFSTIQQTVAELRKQLKKGEVRVAAAVIEQDGLVRIFRRGGSDSYTGKWEFPGGKANPGESTLEALRRELREEFAVDSEIGQELDHYDYKYPNRAPISLTFFAVKMLGAPDFLEHTESAWVRPEQLVDYDLINGDMKFVASRYVTARQCDELRSQIQRERENTDRLAEALEIVSGCYVRCRCGALVCKRCKDDQDVDYALKALAQHAALRSGE